MWSGRCDGGRGVMGMRRVMAGGGVVWCGAVRSEPGGLDVE